MISNCCLVRAPLHWPHTWNTLAQSLPNRRRDSSYSGTNQHLDGRVHVSVIIPILSVWSVTRKLPLRVLSGAVIHSLPPVCTELPKYFAVCTQAGTQMRQDSSNVLPKARLFAPKGAQMKHGNTRTESPNIWLPELPAVPRCVALSSGRQLCWRPLGRSTQSPGERTSQSETALR